MADFDIEQMDFSFELSDDVSALCPACKTAPTKAIKTQLAAITLKRAMSESILCDILPHNFETGEVWHVISGGDVDSLSFLKHIIKQQNLKYCLFSTWCMGSHDVADFAQWVESGKIGYLDAYVGEIFTTSYSKQFEELKQVVNGRICVFKNHSKVMAGIGDKFSFVIESSANINTNPRTEQTVISINNDLFNFYKEWFDGIKSYNRLYDNWKPFDLSIIGEKSVNNV